MSQPWSRILNGGHIGAEVSALVDGQLSEAESDRAWTHVMGCPGCRRLVERDRWTKSRVHALSFPTDTHAPGRLVGALHQMYDADAWAQVDRIERASTRRRAALALVGAGSVGVAVAGLIAVTSPPAGRGELPGSPSPAMIRSDLIGPAVGARVGATAGAAFVPPRHQRH